MGRKFKVSSEEKIFAVQDYLSGKRGATQLQKELQIDNKTLRQWLLKYKLHGEDGLKPIRKNTFYSQLGIPGQNDHQFRLKPITDSGSN